MMQKKTKKFEMDMCSGSILKKMLFFAVPLMCSSILQLLFNAADIIVVGRYAGDNSMAAVGSNTSLISLMTNLFIGLSIGANTTVARYYGAKKEKEVSKTVHTAMVIAFISGILLTIIGCIGARSILMWMDVPEEVLSLAVLYLRIYFLGMTAMMTYNFGSAILRAIGDTKRPLYFLFISGVINVVLNLLFVICFQMDVAGVALATVISQIISAILILRCLLREEGSIRVSISKLHVDRKLLNQIVRIGLPAGFQGVLFALSNVVIQSSVNSFGAIVLSGNTAAANIEGFIYVSMNAFCQAALSFTSQNMGAKRYERIPKILLAAQMYAVITGFLLGNLVVIFGQELLSIFTSDPAIVEAGMHRLQVIARTYALCGIMDVLVGVVRGMGYSVMPMIISLIGACGLRLIWLATIFKQTQFHKINIVYLTYPVSWCITIGALVVGYIWVYRKEIKQAV